MSDASQRFRTNVEGERTPAARILYLDIERAPYLGYYWDPGYEVSTIRNVRDGYILCVAYQFEGDKRPSVVSQLDFPDYYAEHPHCDRKVMEATRELLNSADLVIGHNINRFDLPHIEARCRKHHIKPWSPVKTVDTLLLARKGKHASNKLHDLAVEFGLEGKAPHDGFDTWVGCMAGDEKHWKRMLRYAKQDIKITRLVYRRLRCWARNHPNIATMSNAPDSCPSCGAGPEHLTYDPEAPAFRTNTIEYDQWMCLQCASWFRSRRRRVEVEQIHNVNTTRR